MLLLQTYMLVFLHTIKLLGDRKLDLQAEYSLLKTHRCPGKKLYQSPNKSLWALWTIYKPSLSTRRLPFLPWSTPLDTTQHRDRDQLRLRRCFDSLLCFVFAVKSLSCKAQDRISVEQVPFSDKHTRRWSEHQHIIIIIILSSWNKMTK